MPYNRVADPLLDSGKPARSTDIKKIRDNQDYFNEQISLSPTSGGVQSHFNRADFGASAGTLADVLAGEGIFIEASSAAVWELRIDNTIDAHYIRFAAPSSVNGANLVCMSAMDFTTWTKPLTFKCRLRSAGWAAGDFSGFRIGFANDGVAVTPSMTANTRPQHGIYLEEGAAGANFRFVSSNGGANTVGSDFTKPSDNTWFEVKIEFTDVGGNQAICQIDGVTKETITTNLPTARNLFGMVSLVSAVGSAAVVDVDRISVMSGGAINDHA